MRVYEELVSTTWEEVESRLARCVSISTLGIMAAESTGAFHFLKRSDMPNRLIPPVG
jgi:hypothetical protein